jgi:hypothetical protein
MKNWILHSVPLLGILFYLFAWKLAYPWLGYMLDSDAVGYLTVAERVANGDFFQSINALWSPMNSWLLLVKQHQGMNFFFRAQVWNLFFGMLLLLQTWYLMYIMQVNTLIRVIAQGILSVVMVYLVYYQVFADLLQCLFILTYLIWMISRKNKLNMLTAIVSGMIIGIGFYAKAYTWFFFLLHFLIWQSFLYIQKQQTFKHSLRQGAIGIFTSLAFMSPWIYAIHHKFGVWTVTGLAGKLNMSWYINSGKTFKDSIHLLIPPTYSDSPSFWEDPFPSQGILTGPFSSLSAFIHWIARCFHTTLSAVSCYAELSLFALLLIGWGAYYFLFINRKSIDFKAEKMVVLALCVLPLGYLTMHIETRYLWLSLFLLPIVFDRFVLKHIKRYKTFWAVIWGVSFLVFPFLQFEQLRNKNKDLFQEAQEWRKEKFTQIPFTSSASDEGRMWVLAYLSRSQYYTIEASSYTEAELVNEMKRYRVKWYLQEKGKCNNGLHFNGNDRWLKRFETTRFIAYELLP